MRIIDVRNGETEEQAEARVLAEAERTGAMMRLLKGEAPKQPWVRSSMPRAEYDALNRVNWSSLKVMGKSPAHYEHQKKNGRPDTDALKRGRAVHLAVLEPERFAASVALWDGGIRRGKAWEGFRDANAEKEILTEAEFKLCLALASATRNHPLAAPYLAGGDAEVSLGWSLTSPTLAGSEGWAFDCKGRLDFIADCGAIVDLKTTRDASPEGFGREAWKYCLHGQAAFYVDGYEAATGARLPYVLVAVETEPPHVVQVYRVEEPLLELGRETYRALLDRLALCRRESRWAGYADEELSLTLPRWAAPREEEDVDVSELDLAITE